MLVSDFYNEICGDGCNDTTKGYKIAVNHIETIKPFRVDSEMKRSLEASGVGLVLDDDYSDGVAKAIAFDLVKETGSVMEVLGLKNKTAGFSEKVDNLPPNKFDIEKKVIDILERKK